MKKVMLMGKTGAGKTSLIQALSGQNLHYAKTQSLEYCSSILDTPGEYLENKRFYRALMVSSVDYDVICFLQPANEEANWFPAGFANTFPNKEVVGLITKIDAPDGDMPRSEAILTAAGTTRLFYLSPLTGEGISDFRHFLDNKNQ